ncbi:hypothetical protein [Mycobacteroides chelonae]|uniref:hypothetical protein n=1 Tax=Mycobacteroides chelonae TaxID=1774 RepID=UPI000A3F17FB|nr:hypothetical protein [Mycobacteroides chelonae]
MTSTDTTVHPFPGASVAADDADVPGAGGQSPVTTEPIDRITDPSYGAQMCPICPRPVDEPVFFEGNVVCEEHVRACGYCAGGRRLVDDEACGPCLAVIYPRKAA